jgi:hypothetical protein
MREDSPNLRLKKAALAMPVDESSEPTLPSKVTMDEVRIFFKRYVREVESSSELSQTSKTMYIDFADCFVRWMRGGFKPGSRGSNRRRPTVRIWPGKLD